MRRKDRKIKREQENYTGKEKHTGKEKKSGKDIRLDSLLRSTGAVSRVAGQSAVSQAPCDRRLVLL